MSMQCYILALNQIIGIGPVTYQKAMAVFGNAAKLFAASKNDLLSSHCFSRKIIDSILDPIILENAYEEKCKADRAGIKIITIEDSDYPPLLKEIYAPPFVLYISGNHKLLTQHSVGVVGMRSPSDYGSRAVRFISEGLVQHGIVIVSGMAHGIDTIAHETCISQNGKTIAVLGCGVDICYPASNRSLAKRIVETGALVSEFPLGVPPVARNFPRRNRIISGLTPATVVIEAAERSGSLITADYALQQGREVFAVPGSIFSQKSIGTFRLINNGATPIRSAKDIIENLSVSTISCLPIIKNSKPEPVLNDSERSFINMLPDAAMRVDQIAELSGLSIPASFSMLLTLELKGAITVIAGQHYKKTI